MNTALEEIDSARFRATAGDVQGFGATPREALDALMIRLPDSPETPIVIWPFNHGDLFSLTLNSLVCGISGAAAVPSLRPKQPS